MGRLDRGDPTDREILAALAEGKDRPQFAADLSTRLGLPPQRVPARLSSLVSLGYVAVPLVGKGQDDGYTLTERGAAELIRLGGGDRPADRPAR